jgi:hypothetical protein
MASPIIDIYLVYEFIKRLVTPFNKTKAFSLGLIDADGKKLRTAVTSQEKDAMGYFDRLVFNLKRILEKVPLGKSQIASYAAALLLLRERNEATLIGDYPLQLREKLYDQMKALELNEDVGAGGAPANATGAAVVGTGDDVASFKGTKTRKSKTISNVILRRKGIKTEDSKCNKTSAGINCPSHGIKSCGY